MSSAYTRVYRAANTVEAHMLKGMLEQHGVRARILGGGLSSGVGELPVDVIQVSIEVPVGYRQLARELIEAYESGRADGTSGIDAWVCGDCNESNPASFDVCWQCGDARGRGGMVDG
jgi:hypothetical protein